MSLRAHFQPGATVVQVHGVLQAANAVRLARYLDGLDDTARLVIVDLRGVDFFSDDGLYALIDVVRPRAGSRARRALVAGAGLRRLLHVTGGTHPLLVAGSVPEALQRLASGNPARSPAQRITSPVLTRC